MSIHSIVGRVVNDPGHIAVGVRSRKKKGSNAAEESWELQFLDLISNDLYMNIMQVLRCVQQY